MTLTLYGIPNCDTVKKARKWLDERQVAYAFHAYKKQGADPARIAGWVEQAGWETVLNRRGTTFRGLPEADRADIDAGKAVALMAAHPSCIKRPVLQGADEREGLLLVGFEPAKWEAALG